MQWTIWYRKGNSNGKVEVEATTHAKAKTAARKLIPKKSVITTVVSHPYSNPAKKATLNKWIPAKAVKFLKGGITQILR